MRRTFQNLTVKTTLKSVDLTKLQTKMLAPFYGTQCTPLGVYLWPPYVIGGPLYFCPVISSFFFFSPNLSRHRLGVYHTLTHGVALVRI